MKTIHGFMIAALLMFSTQTLAAERDCESIHQLSEQWDKVSTYIDDHSDDGKLRKSEVRRVIADLKVLVPPTRKIGNVLVNDLKGSDERRMQAVGKQILAALDEFNGLKDDEDDWNDVTDIFDRLVDLIDKVGDWCEK
jgi:hypothetical protein